jgi:group I intron endonuclease
MRDIEDTEDTEDTIGYIYEFTNKVNNKKYIGQTWDINRRIREHKNGWGFAKLLKSAIKKYGIDNFNIRILFKTKDQIILDNAEIISIELSGCLSPNGYNLDLGGSSGKKSEATKQLIGSYHKNKIVSLETREKIRKKLLNRKMKDETKNLISEKIIEHYKNNDKPVFIFNCLTHCIIETYKNMKIAEEEMKIPINRIYGSISAKSKFKFNYIYCYASYSDIPLNKKFKIGIKVRIIRKDGRKRDYDSIKEATDDLNINRGVISNIVRGKYKWSSFIEENNKVYFTAEYLRY